MTIESDEDPKAACEDLAEPMGELLGGAAAVPAFAVAAAPFVETGPAAIVVGSAAGYGAYDSVREIVVDNWGEAICDNLANAAAPPPELDWSATDPFSADESPFQTSFDEIAAPPEASVTIFDSSPSDPGGSDYGAGTFGGSPSFDGGSSYDGGGSSGGGGSSDGGGSSSD